MNHKGRRRRRLIPDLLPPPASCSDDGQLLMSDLRLCAGRRRAVMHLFGVSKHHDGQQWRLIKKRERESEKKQPYSFLIVLCSIVLLPERPQNLLLARCTSRWMTGRKFPFLFWR